jgi:hypothetical protein
MQTPSIVTHTRDSIQLYYDCRIMNVEGGGCVLVPGISLEG